MVWRAHWRGQIIEEAWVAALMVLLMVCAGSVRAEAIRIDGRDRIALSPFETFHDPDKALTIADIREGAAGRFVMDPRTAENRSLGFTGAALWLRAELVVAPDAAGRRVLTLDVPNFNSLAAWGSWTELADTTPLAVLGDRAPRTMPGRLHAAPIDLPAGRHTLWFRATTNGAMAVNLELWRPDALARAEQRGLQIHTALATITAMLGLAALLLAVALRSAAMVLYAGSALATVGYLLMMTGLDTLMWGGHLFDTGNPFVWQAIASALGLGFLFAALPPWGRSGWAVPVLGAPAAVVAALLAFYALTENHDAMPVVMIGPRNLSLMILASGVAVSLRSRLSGYRPATYLILGWLALAAGNVVTALRNAGLVPWTDAAYYLPVYASVVETMLFGAMLAAQLHMLRVEKEEAQRSLMTVLRRSEAELAERVAQRTEALDRANAALRDREAQLRVTLEAAPLPILLSRMTGATIYANHRARTLLLGGDDETEIAQAGDDFYHDPADRGRVLDRLARDGLVENLEVEMRDIAGSRFWALLSMVVIDYEGQKARLLAVNDISRRRQLEQELTKAKELAETSAGLERAAGEAQRQFLAMITHEFRTPLAVISIAAQYLGLKAEDPAAQERLARVGRAVRHMNGMIDACLLDDRIEGAGLLLRSDILDLKALVRRVVDAAQAAAPNHVFTIAAEDLPENLRATAGDEQLLGMALSNLTENAVKYSRPGSVVAVSLKGDGSDAVLCVADQGPGISNGERDRIFEKYYRCAGTGRVPGAGLGLYLTRRIVAAHGGTVGVRNRPGGGALFTLRLPLHGAFAADPESAWQNGVIEEVGHGS
ncbi:ATP-binding protein [Azospirillum doebereinerae]